MCEEYVDLSSNLYDQNTYVGRAAHFYRSVNPFNLFKNHTNAKNIVDQVLQNGGKVPAGLSATQVWDAKYIYDSAYHPTTGELVFMPGRMSFQGNQTFFLHFGRYFRAQFLYLQYNRKKSKKTKIEI